MSRYRKKKRMNSGSIAASIAFLVVFPVYFLYQTLAQLGYIEPFLGTYFTAGAVAATPLLVVAYLLTPLNQRSSRSSVTHLFFALLYVFSISVGAGIVMGAPEETTSPHLAYVFKFVVLFWLARLVDGQARSFHRVCTVALIGIIATVAALGSEGQLLGASLIQASDGGYELDYQGLAFAYIVMLIYCATGMTRALRLLLYVVSVGMLFLIGARSEFVALFLLAATIEFCKARSRGVFLLLLTAMTAIGFATYLIAARSLPDQRMFALLDLGDDQSAIERARVFELALGTIADSPLFGAYASYPPGDYAHNIFSAWVDLGLVGFILLAILLVAPSTSLLGKFLKYSRSDLYVQSLASLMVTLLLLAFAKSYTYQLMPIAIGLYCRFMALRGQPNLLTHESGVDSSPRPRIAGLPHRSSRRQPSRVSTVFRCFQPELMWR